MEAPPPTPRRRRSMEGPPPTPRRNRPVVQRPAAEAAVISNAAAARVPDVRVGSSTAAPVAGAGGSFSSDNGHEGGRLARPRWADFVAQVGLSGRSRRSWIFRPSRNHGFAPGGFGTAGLAR